MAKVKDLSPEELQKAKNEILAMGIPLVELNNIEIEQDRQ
jgi:hypothetical protein